MLAQRERFRGALLGLAVGDAIGTTVEFKPPGSFPPVTDMVGGGPFHLAPGQWTDDTSMALCLAESLLECQGFDARDQMERYVRWWRQGYHSSTGHCFDIGNTVRQALISFEQTGNPIAGPTHEWSAGNGSLMRLAPVPMYFLVRGGVDPVAMSAESSRTTHGVPVAVEACRYFGAVLVDALAGASKDHLLGAKRDVSHPLIAAIAAGSFATKQPPAIRGTGYVVQCLEAALWAFYRSASFEEGCLLAVNLGDDADTTAAVYGQLAGAHYGERGIPERWRKRLAKRDLIESFADRLAGA
ncbi:MAG TPA: ADP-ribosylglycohydrolase family protein [Gemmatimonadaceae bacterium]|nr:ADP-ribosylglycohydrolase family protein [Gemmatimonadaceae bacterium]